MLKVLEMAIHNAFCLSMDFPDSLRFILLFLCLIHVYLYHRPLIAGVVGAPQVTSYQFPPFFSVLHCPLGLGELQAHLFPDVVFPPPPLSALSSSPFHCASQDGFWPDLMNGKHDHTTAVCVSLQSSGDLRVVQLPAGSWLSLIHI